MKKFHFFIVLCLIPVVVFAGSGEEKIQKKAMKPVLLVIDIQNQYLPMVPEREKEIALWMINASIQLFREHGFPVVRVYHTDLKYGPKPDSKTFEFPESVKIKPDDLKIIKNYPNAFKKTELHKALQKLKGNTLFLCGLSAVGCVLATYFGAMDLDYNVFMIKNAIMSHNSTYTKSIEDIFEALGFTALKIMLASAQK